jgi:hypothetical protein
LKKSKAKTPLYSFLFVILVVVSQDVDGSADDFCHVFRDFFGVFLHDVRDVFETVSVVVFAKRRRWSPRIHSPSSSSSFFFVFFGA